MASNRTTYSHTISNPNTNAIMSMLHGSLEQKNPTAVGFKMVHMGSNKLLVSILDIAPLNGKAWQKTTTFDCLASTMRIHMDNLAIPDLITVVSTKLPLNTTTSLTEVEVVKRNIVSLIYDVTNSVASCF